jgi:TetR/AcrR family transcriptional regulator
MAHPKHLPAEQRRNDTVRALIALAAEQNPTDITTAAVAKRMGLTQGALFRHFPSKDAILEAVMEWVAERLLARIDKAAQTASSPLTAVEAIFLTHIEFVIEHPGVPRMLIGELQRSEDTVAKGMVRTLLRCYTERLIRLMEEGKKQGQLDAASIQLLLQRCLSGPFRGWSCSRCSREMCHRFAAKRQVRLPSIDGALHQENCRHKKAALATITATL